MQKLSQIPAQTSVFVLEVEGNKQEKDRLHSLGFIPERIITVIQNPKGKMPMVVEVFNSRFAVSKDIANEVFVSNVLDSQSLIFDAHHNKKTDQRDLILQVLKNQKGHFALSEFTETVRKEDQKIGKITVYRTLKLLVEKGILEVIAMPDGQRMFELKKGHHDHIICEKCGEIMEFHNDEIEKLQEKIAKQHNVELNKHKLKLFAESCPKCRK